MQLNTQKNKTITATANGGTNNANAVLNTGSHHCSFMVYWKRASSNDVAPKPPTSTPSMPKTAITGIFQNNTPKAQSMENAIEINHVIPTTSASFSVRCRQLPLFLGCFIFPVPIAMIKVNAIEMRATTMSIYGIFDSVQLS